MFTWTAGAAALIFRFETLIFLGLYVLTDLVKGKVNVFLQILKTAVPAAVVLLGKYLVLFIFDYIYPSLVLFAITISLSLSQRSPLVCGVYFMSLVVFLFQLFYPFLSRSPRIL